MQSQTQTTPDIIDYEKRGRDFLEYVSTHEKEIKSALRKNVTYDRDLLDDTFGDSIIKIHASITKNHVEVKDYKMYIFQSMRWAYLCQQNKLRKREQVSLRNYYDNPRNDDGGLDYDYDYSDEDDREDLVMREARQTSADRILDLLKSQLAGIYGEEWVNIYLHYYTAKINGRSMSYERMAQHYGRPLPEVRRNLSQMKSYVRESFDFSFA